MAIFKCLNCNQKYTREVIAETRLSDMDIKKCPWCGSTWTELVPDAEMKPFKLPGLSEVIDAFQKGKMKINMDSLSGFSPGLKSDSAPIKNNFIIWVLTRDGVEIRQKYANTKFKAEDYLKPSPLGPDFLQIEYENDGGNWDAAQIPRDRIIFCLITDGNVDCENIHRMRETYNGF